MRTGGVVAPSPEVWAVVRHADPPELVPDELVAYVVPSYVDGCLDDWSLTDDVIAFGSVDTPVTFQRWRASWERTWPLDPRSNMRRLSAIARELAPELGLVSEPLLDLVADDELTIEQPGVLRELAAELERLRDAIRRRDSTGFGFVDATEGRSRVGLARAWSPTGGDELLAADGMLEAWMRPGVGLQVELHTSPPCSLEAVEEVTVRAAGVEVRSAAGTDLLPPEHAAALAWLVPGAARWRVRPVPEVLVWARTFGGLPECCRYAAAAQRAVTLRNGEAPPPSDPPGFVAP